MPPDFADSHERLPTTLNDSVPVVVVVVVAARGEARKVPG